MKQSINIKSIGESITLFFARFHSLLFFLTLSIALVSCLVIVVSIVNLSGSTDASTENQLDQTFDEPTINRLEQLQDADGGEKLELPAGRTNPFSE